MTADGTPKSRPFDLWNYRRGSRRKLSSAQAALIFECQVQIRAMKALIERTLDEAGYSPHSNGRSVVRTYVLVNRGLVDNTSDEAP
jgi:hypothetical protein